MIKAIIAGATIKGSLRIPYHLPRSSRPPSCAAYSIGGCRLDNILCELDSMRVGRISHSPRVLACAEISAAAHTHGRAPDGLFSIAADSLSPFPSWIRLLSLTSPPRLFYAILPIGGIVGISEPLPLLSPLVLEKETLLDDLIHNGGLALSRLHRRSSPRPRLWLSLFSRPQ